MQQISLSGRALPRPAGELTALPRLPSWIKELTLKLLLTGRERRGEERRREGTRREGRGKFASSLKFSFWLHH